MKKVLALVLCAALLLSLAACGGAGNTSTVAPASASEASGASTAEPAAGEKIKVGYDIYFLGNSWYALWIQPAYPLRKARPYRGSQ